MTDLQTVSYDIVVWLLDAVVIATSIIFILRYIQCSKTLGLKFVFGINMFTWVFPIIDLVRKIVATDETAANAIAITQAGLFKLVILWVMVFSIFTYDAVKRSGGIYTRVRYVFLALVMCLLFAASFCIMLIFRVWGLDEFQDDIGSKRYEYPLTDVTNQLKYFMVFEMLGQIAPALVTFIFYLKTYLFLNSASKGIVRRSKFTFSRIILIGISPLVCFLPLSIADLVCMCLGVQRPFGVNLMRAIAFRVWGISNLINYWFFLPAGKGIKDEEDSFLNDSPWRLDNDLSKIVTSWS